MRPCTHMVKETIRSPNTRLLSPFITIARLRATAADVVTPRDSCPKTADDGLANTGAGRNRV